MGFASTGAILVMSPVLIMATTLAFFVSTYQDALKRGKNSYAMMLLGRSGTMQVLHGLILLSTKAFPKKVLNRMRVEGRAKAALLERIVPLKKSKSDKPLVCFAGSSTFTYWLNVEKYFPKYNVYNAAFGGSVTSLVLELADELIIKHRPNAVVFYCGTNDITFRMPPSEIYANFCRLHERVRAKVGEHVCFIYVSMLPTPQNFTIDSPEIIATMLEVNRRIETFCNSSSKTIFIDAASEPFVIDPKYFLFDNKHLLPRGHAKLAALISPALDRLDL